MRAYGRLGLLLAAVGLLLAGPTSVQADPLPPTIDLNSTAADLTVYGDDAGDYSGHALAAGDINGDGTDDLIIGALRADPAGETYVIYGAASQPVGGIAELPDVAEGSEWPVPNCIALVAGLAAALPALTAGAWYGRRRWLS